MRAFVTIVLSVLLLSGGSAFADKRVALVIGNGAYVHSPQLLNPASDAALVSSSLRQLGFEVVQITDGTHRALLDGMSEFGKQAQGADTALFYYAGHGLEVAGRNWILPIDANIEASADLPSSAVKVDDVLELMELSDARIRLVVLDACRNNPLPRSLTRSSNRGLAKIDASAAGTMVVFSAAPGEVALDGSGANSPFSEALASRITQPGLEIRQMMGRVRQDVLAATNDKQVPWVNEAIAGDFYLAGKDGSSSDTSSPPAAQPPASNGLTGELSVELAFWDSVKDSRNKDLINLYLQKYPQGSFTDLANALIASLDNVNSVPRSTPQAPQVPQVDRSAQMEQAAREFVRYWNGVFSGPADNAVSQVYSLYASNVDFYGKRFSSGQIASDKQKLVSRWPERYYDSPEGEMNIYCNPAAGTCDVTTLQYWTVSSTQRNQSRSGVSRTNLRIDFNTGSPVVVFESGEAIQRN
ncbi:MAG: caspase family protein [Rhizobiaceae bacterium]